MARNRMILAVLMLGMAGAAFAGAPGERQCPNDPGGRGPGGPGGGPHVMMMAMHQVELTDEQRAMLRDLREGKRDERETDRPQMEQLRTALHAEITAEKPNRATIKRLMSELDDMRDAHRSEMVDDMLTVLATFTPEQRAQLRQALDNPPAGPPEGGRCDHAGGGRGPGGGPQR